MLPKFVLPLRTAHILQYNNRPEHPARACVYESSKSILSNADMNPRAPVFQGGPPWPPQHPHSSRREFVAPTPAHVNGSASESYNASDVDGLNHDAGQDRRDLPAPASQPAPTTHDSSSNNPQGQMPPPPPPGFEDRVSPGISPGTPPGIPSETLRRAQQRINAAAAVAGLRDLPFEGSPEGRRIRRRANPYHLSTWEGAHSSEDHASGPIVIHLGLDNYLNWEILMRRKIERNGWIDLIDESRQPNPTDGTIEDEKEGEERDSTEDLELRRRRVECSTYILEHIQERYWHMFNPCEVDPCILWREIRDAWQMHTPGAYRFFLGLEGLEIGQGRVFDFVAQFRWLYNSYLGQTGAHRLCKKRLNRMMARGLENRFPDFELGLVQSEEGSTGEEIGERNETEGRPVSLANVSEALDYLRGLMSAEYRLNVEQEAIVQGYDELELTVGSDPQRPSERGVRQVYVNGGGAREEPVLVNGNLNVEESGGEPARMNGNSNGDHPNGGDTDAGFEFPIEI